MAESQVETVTWINVIPLNRREKIARWWVESVRQRQTYVSRRNQEQEFQSRISVDMIDQLASDGLRGALLDQRRERREGSVSITFPRATPDGSEYFGSILIPSRPLAVMFTAEGIVERPTDENH